MLRYFAILALASVFMFSILSALLQLIGSAQPPPPALQGFERCVDMPCWLNIDPRVTTPDEARAILYANDYQSPDGHSFYAPSGSGLCNLILREEVFMNAMIISTMELSHCQEFTLGDFTQVLRAPYLIGYNRFNGWALWYRDSLSGSVSIGIAVGDSLSLHSTVTMIVYLHSAEIVACGVSWHGFVPLWRYNQLESNFREC